MPSEENIGDRDKRIKPLSESLSLDDRSFRGSRMNFLFGRSLAGRDSEIFLCKSVCKRME